MFLFIIQRPPLLPTPTCLSEELYEEAVFEAYEEAVFEAYEKSSVRYF